MLSGNTSSSRIASKDLVVFGDVEDSSVESGNLTKESKDKILSNET